MISRRARILWEIFSSAAWLKSSTRPQLTWWPGFGLRGRIATAASSWKGPTRNGPRRGRKVEVGLATRANPRKLQQGTGRPFGGLKAGGSRRQSRPHPGRQGILRQPPTPVRSPGQSRRLSAMPGKDGEDQPTGVSVPTKGHGDYQPRLPQWKRRPNRGSPFRRMHGRNVSRLAGAWV